MDDVNTGVYVQGDRIQGIALRLACIDYRGRLKEHIGSQELVCKYRGAGSGNAQRAEAQLDKELPPIEVVYRICTCLVLILGHSYLIAPAGVEIVSLGRAAGLIASTEIRPVGSAGISL